MAHLGPNRDGIETDIDDARVVPDARALYIAPQGVGLEHQLPHPLRPSAIEVMGAERHSAPMPRRMSDHCNLLTPISLSNPMGPGSSTIVRPSGEGKTPRTIPAAERCSTHQGRRPVKRRSKTLPSMGLPVVARLSAHGAPSCRAAMHHRAWTSHAASAICLIGYATLRTCIHSCEKGPVGGPSETPAFLHEVPLPHFCGIAGTRAWRTYHRRVGPQVFRRLDTCQSIGQRAVPVNHHKAGSLDAPGEKADFRVGRSSRPRQALAANRTAVSSRFTGAKLRHRLDPAVASRAEQSPGQEGISRPTPHTNPRPAAGRYVSGPAD